MPLPCIESHTARRGPRRCVVGVLLVDHSQIFGGVSKDILQKTRFLALRQSSENIRAIRNAAAAARPPISVVCRALRAGRVPVNRPLM